MQVSLLLQHRKQWDAVCRNAALIPGAVAEALRYEPSVGSVPRFTLAEIEIDGVTVPAHRLLTLSTVSAMRDPECHEEPDRFNIRRADQRTRHLVFGGGSHRCLGEALAKAELEEGLAVLAARLPQLQIIGEPAKMLGHSGIRRVTGMRVGWVA
jgi:cytochrome P450